MGIAEADPSARKPYLAVAFGPSAPFQLRFVTDTFAPLVVSAPFQTWFSGQDVVAAGISGAMVGGLTATSAVLGRNVLDSLSVRS